MSIVLPVLNEGKHIRNVLDSLLTQRYPRDGFEIILVDGGSTDETVSVATHLSQAHPNLVVLKNPRRLSSSGRNIGVKASRGDVVLFVDGHCEIPDELLLEHLRDLFQRTSADIVCRPQPLDASGTSRLGKAIAVARSSWLGHNPNSLIFSTNREGFVNPESSGAAYTRGVFRQIGYFDESFDACEDVDFNLRARKAGLKAFTSTSVAIRYYPREGLGPLLRQMLRYGLGRAQFFAKHPKEAMPSAILLGVLPLLGMVLVTLSAFSQRSRLLLLFLALAYVVAAVLVSFGFSSRRDLRLGPYVFTAIVTIHLGLFCGFWKGLASRGRKRVKRGRSGAPTSQDRDVPSVSVGP
jgi:GT2 family glycosyltransferase